MVLPGEATPEALHAGALLDVLSQSGERTLDRAISTLRSAAALSDNPAPVLNDLAAALLLRAQAAQNPRDAAEAIDVSERAMSLNSGNPAILFNRALALEAWGLDGDAAAAWHDYLAVDPDSRWADEARQHLHVAQAPVAPERVKPAATPDELRAFAARSPEAAWEAGWKALAGWSQAVLARDGAGAERALARAETLGHALQGHDATLGDAAEEIRRHQGDSAAVRLLASGHRAYARARADLEGLAFDSAVAGFRKILDPRPPSPSLESWTRQGYAAALIGAGKFSAADTVLRLLEPGMDRARRPILAGRVRWSRATLEHRLKHPDAVIGPAHEAADLLIRAGVPRLSGGALYVAADGETAVGALQLSHEDAREALRRVASEPGSVWRCNTLASAARTALADGLPYMALRLQDERVGCAGLNGHPEYLAEALAGRAQTRAAMGDRQGALRDAEQGYRVLASVAPGSPFQKLRGDLEVARATAYLASDPRRAASIASEIVRSPAASGQNGAPRLYQALVLRANARLALGDAAGAAADLESAVRVLVPNRTAVLAAPFRLSLAEASRAAFDQLVMLRLDAGDTLGALRDLERGRVSLGFHPAATAERPLSLAAPRGEVALDYALVGDTLLVFVLGDGPPRLVRARVRREELLAGLGQLGVQLERGDPEPAVRPRLERLFETMLRPVAGRIGGRGARLVIVADGELAGVPFAALFDRRSGRYMVDDHVIRQVPSLADAAEAGPAARPPARISIVAAPAYDMRAYAGLERLTRARPEADSIAALYPAAELLSGPQATKEAVRGALGRAPVFHFTGHALFDPERPERSSLVLAPRPGTAGAQPLQAVELDSIHLRGTRLVVLSACETMRPSAGRGSAFAGFAAAFLTAGATGVVGGSWRVGDDASNRLMVEFHHAYRATGQGAASLQAAQKTLLHSGRPEWSSPSAWAAFRYAGN